MSVSADARLERNRRAYLMAEMYESGMTTHQIGKALHLDRSQVSRDLRGIAGLVLRPAKASATRRVACAICGALPGEPCERPEGQSAYHPTRKRAAEGVATPFEVVEAQRKRHESFAFWREDEGDVPAWRDAAALAERIKRAS